ncbi:hypothetical protein BD626DRAFT_566271 [Schizophyllum amplum]|uniref:Uncharacterized protein n=1 Tax=Schizophyllum amplum TaxID=97359 RepID=A0A550CR38_9AGAR|nr:hypothetical protein BD626DRAFT_566271 [Auriculariopsis ampla]
MVQTPQSNNSGASRRGALAYILNPPSPMPETDAPGRSPRAYQDTPPRAAYVPGGDRSRMAPVQQSYGPANPTIRRAPPALTPHNMSPSIPAPLVWLSPALSSSADPRANRKIHSFSTSGGFVKYIYIGQPTRNGRNVLQRVEDMSIEPDIKSFGPYDIICAGCDHAFSTRNGSAMYQNNAGSWEMHHCNTLRDWNNPASPRKLTPEMAAEFAHSRMVSRDRALAHLVEVNQIERVYY